MTRRERMERKVEKREEWADGRERKASAAQERVHQIADGIPFGQPILVGHHSEGRHRRDVGRIESGMREAVDSSRMADTHRERASNLQHQLDTSVYDDDEDAVERLEARIAERETERDRLKAYNASCRRGAPDESVLDDRQRADIRSIREVVPYQLGKGGAFPSYALSNLGATIRKDKERLERLRREAAPDFRERPRQMVARFSSTCDVCGQEIQKGETILYYKRARRAIHDAHGTEA